MARCQDLIPAKLSDSFYVQPMIGKLNPDSREATVIGAGFAGLLIAFRLQRRGFRVTLHEAQSRAGGLISTRRLQWGIAESAAHSFQASLAVIELCKELEVELVPLNPKNRSKYILKNGKFRKFPLNIAELLTLLWKISRQSPPLTEENPSLETWALHYLTQPALDYLINPFLRGVFACKPSEISIQAAFPQLLFEKERTILSGLQNLRRRRPASPMMAPQEGMESLIQKLSGYLEKKLGDRYLKNSRIERLPESGNVIICTPAPVAAALLNRSSPELSELLDQVQYSPLISITIFLEKSQLGNPREGVGVLVPEKENRGFLGVLFNSSAFPSRVVNQEKIVSLTMMMGGSDNPSILEMPDQELLQNVESELKALFDLRGRPVHCEIHRWPNAIPQYGPHLQRVWEKAQSSWCSRAGNILFGNYTGQVSLRGMIESTMTLDT